MPYAVSATASPASASVQLVASGDGVPGATLYLFRRDSDGVTVVRDTSEGTVTWPTNLATVQIDPTSTAAPWYFQVGTSEVVTRAVVTNGVGPRDRAVPFQRATVTTARTAGTSGHYYRSDVGAGPAGVAGDVRTMSMWVRLSHARSLQLQGSFRAGATTAGTTTGALVAVPANVWTKLSVTVTATGAYDNVQLFATLPSGQTAIPVGGTYDATEPAVQTSGSVTVTDHEARQGEGTDYLLADGDGVQLASVRIDLPKWGTWVKSPGRPFLNTRVHFERELPVQRGARREVVQVEGSRQAVVLSQPRATETGDLQLVTLTAAQDAAITRLLEDGGTVMLDSDPLWRVPYRYMNVGDVTTGRAYFDSLGLALDARTHQLAGIVSVEAPIGVTALDPGRTYDVLPTLFGSYAAMAATVPTYEALATGAY